MDALESTDLVDDLRKLRENRFGQVSWESIPLLAIALDRYSPATHPRYRGERLKTFLTNAISRVEEPWKEGLNLAFGFHSDTAGMGSNDRREGFARHFGYTGNTVRRRGHVEDQAFTRLADALLELLAEKPAAAVLASDPQPDRPPAPRPEPTVPSRPTAETPSSRITLAPDPYTLGAEDRLGDVLLDASILDFRGVDLARVAVVAVGLIEEQPEHPTLIEDARAHVPPPEPNRPKAHLVGWHAPVQDQGNILGLDLAKSDYWTTLATRDRIDVLRRQIEGGERDLMTLPRRLDVHLVVVTGVDDKILLTRRGTNVATEPGTWMVSVGESIDWDKDALGDAPHPLATARRCLEDLDELHLPAALASSATFTLVAIATEWNEMLANLIVVAEIPELSVPAARAAFRRGENVALDAVDFSIPSAMAVVDSAEFRAQGASSPQRVSDISRIALLATLRYRFGSDSV